ncbi:hypothetical protein PRUB_a2158 [Pseudoalteromonas rubra]|uniref:Uncharacterized protein n=1 Tax=Pseudoalteromonas rubra TaxID=43658 RepID=A0A8T0CHX3_9GAMM|nr:hypothetical protein PRUB_a2158 [Pseudoalteromonas rubra]
MNDFINGKELKANRVYKDDLDYEGQLHGTHPEYNHAMKQVLDAIDSSNRDDNTKKEMLIEVIERAKIHLDMNEPPLMNKHGSLREKWVEVLMPAIDRRKN